MLSGRRREIAVALVIVAVLAGCTGAWSDGGASPTPTGTSTGTSTGTPIDAPTATDGSPATTAAGPSATTSGTTTGSSTTVTSTTDSTTARTTDSTTHATTPSPSTTPSNTGTTAPPTTTTAPPTTTTAPPTTTTAPPTTTTAPPTTTTARSTTTRSTTTDDADGTEVGGAALFDDHAAAVRSAGSYAADFAVSTRQVDGDGGDDVSVEGTLEAEIEPDVRTLTLRHRSADGERTQAQYLPPDAETVAMCLEPDGGECVDRRQRSLDGTPSLAPFDLTTPTSSATLGAATAVYTDEGLVSTDDGERRRYVVDDAADLGATGDDTTAHEARVVVDVDPDTSRITAVEYDVTIEDAAGDRYRIGYLVEYAQFGGVDAGAPAWYEG